MNSKVISHMFHQFPQEPMNIFQHFLSYPKWTLSLRVNYETLGSRKRNKLSVWWTKGTRLTDRNL